MYSIPEPAESIVEIVPPPRLIFGMQCEGVTTASLTILTSSASHFAGDSLPRRVLRGGALLPRDVGGVSRGGGQVPSASTPLVGRLPNDLRGQFMFL